MDNDKFLRDLDLDIILENEDGLESVLKVFNGNVINVSNKYAPEKMMNFVQQYNKPWYCDEIRT